MTKGALKQRYIPHDPEWHDSDLFGALVIDLGLGAPTVWMVLKAEWIEPEAEVIEREHNGEPRLGLYRQCRFSHLWNKFPAGSIGNKKLAKIMLWLHDREQWILDPGTSQDLHRIHTEPSQSLHRNDLQTQHKVGAWSYKWLEFREACLGYRKGEERRGKEDGSTEPNQDQTEPDFDYVRNPETGEWDHVSLAEKELRESIDD